MINNESPILIFDEDNVCRHMVGDVLQRHDFFVVETSTAGQATAALEGNPRLIIVGYNRAQSSAVQWMTRLREQGNKTPIVILSSTWCDAKTFYLLRNVLNVSLILQKPIAPNLLMNQLEFVLPSKPALGPASVAFNPAPVIDSVAEANSSEEAALDGADMNDFLDEIKREYAAQLPGVWTELLTCVDLLKSEHQYESLPDAIGFAHKLRGNAGAYGFPELSAIAERVEHLLGLAACTASEDRDGFWSLIDTALDEGTSFINALADVRNNNISISYSKNLPKILVVGNGQSWSSSPQMDFAEFVFAGDAESARAKAAKSPFAGAVLEINDACTANDLLELTRELRQSCGNESLPLAVVAQGGCPVASADLAYAGISVVIDEPIANGEQIEDLVRTLVVLRQSLKSKILVIDDDVASTNFIKAQLTRAGHIVHCVNEPIETFGVLSTFVPDLILLDVFMPGLSGYDVCRIMRTMPQVSSVPILFITARNDQEVRSAAFQAGGSDFLLKPIVGDELVARVKCHLLAAELSGERKTTDPRTHVPMLGSKMSDLESWLVTCRQNDVAMSMCLIKLERWEEIMLTDSPSTAERCLSSLSRLVQLRFKTEDVRARWGDAGFTIAFPTERRETIRGAIALLRYEYEQMKFTARDGREFSCAISSSEADSTEGIESLADLMSLCYKRLEKSSRARERAMFCSSIHGMKKLRTAVKPRQFSEDSRGSWLNLTTASPGSLRLVINE
ncbi:MAG TPA: response regulator [Planktothrix sp.]|jgi:DNA-binding response OmpR family regulator